MIERNGISHSDSRVSSTSPVISVITAVYNQEHFLRETIESVISQTFTDWEYILIDDGSSDKSPEIAKDYATKYPGKIIYLEHEDHVNKGVSATRNLGLQNARGEYFSLVDGDDLWISNKLQNQVNILQKHPEVAMICESSYYWKNGSTEEADTEKVDVGVPGNRVYTQPELALKLHPLGKGLAPCVGGLTIKTCVLQALGGFEAIFVGKNSLYEDQAFLMKIYLTEPVFVSSECNNTYRLHQQSAMHSIIAQGHEARARHFYLKWLAEYIKEREIQIPAVEKMLTKAFWPYDYPILYTTITGTYSILKRGVKKDQENFFTDAW